MRKEWICRWQLAPGGAIQTQVFSTQTEARKAMAKILADAVDLGKYTRALRKEKGEDCNSSADFLEKFLSELSLPQTDEEIPSHIDVPDHCLLEIYPEVGFRWEYMRGECPSLVVSNFSYVDGTNPFVIDFCFENPRKTSGNRVNGVGIRMDERIHYGTSAYPLMVWRVLQEEPQTLDQIIYRIWEQYDEKIDRKAVGRHLNLLEKLGYPVQHSRKGYCRWGAFRNPEPDVHYSPNAYPLLVLQVLDKTPKMQAEIIQAIQEKYGVTMDRKAVGRHLALLEALGYRIEKGKCGASVRDE